MISQIQRFAKLSRRIMARVESSRHYKQSSLLKAAFIDSDNNRSEIVIRIKESEDLEEYYLLDFIFSNNRGNRIGAFYYKGKPEYVKLALDIRPKELKEINNYIVENMMDIVNKLKL